MSDNESNTNYTTPSRNLVAQASDFETQTSPASSRPVSYIQSPNTPTPEPRVFRPRPKSETFAKKDHVVRFADPQTDDAEELDIPQRLRSPSSTWTAHSEDDSAYSELSDGNIGTSMQPRKRRRRAPRSAMRYLVAQPPTPKHRRFIHARPKLLLQLQQFTDVRPKPAFDVLSSNVLRGSLLGSSSMMNRFPRLLGRGAHLGPNDLIVAESEDYDSLAPVDDHDPLSNRELLAVISPRIAPEGGTDIVLADGSIWTAYQMPNASYEFHNINEDGHTVIARWVKRKIAFEDEEHYKYTFSLIDRATRRHPILGTLTQSTLEVLNQYTTVSPNSAGRHPPTRPFSFDANGASPIPYDMRTSERSVLPVDHQTRIFMTVSAIWISLQLLGPKPARAYSSLGSPSTTSVSVNGSVRSRRVSGTPSILSTPCQSSSTYQPTSIPSSPVVSIPTKTPSSQPSIPASELKRASSTGAAFMRRRMSAQPEKRKLANSDSFAEGYVEPPAKIKLYTKIKRALGFKMAEPIH